MYGYIAIYKGKRLEVYAESSYKAQLEAAKQFKAKKSYDVSVYLCEKDGQAVEQSTCI
jgi:hypothetical protein